MNFGQSSRSTAGVTLTTTMIMTTVALLLLAGILAWSLTNSRLSARAGQYTRSVAAAEAATEKSAGLMVSDYLSGGESLVTLKLSSYTRTVPTSSDSLYWADWKFTDGQNNGNDRTYVALMGTNSFMVTNGAYAGLQAYASVYHIVSDAQLQTGLQNVKAGVLQELELTRIPIFQFAMYSSGEMEISCGAPFVISGPVHCNGILYVEPDNLLTFQSAVTAGGSVIFNRDPLDTRGSNSGTATFNVPWKSNSPALTLPIGVSNTPIAVRDIIEPPPALEAATSSLGRLRYYNQVDLIITATDTGVTASNGLTAIPTNQVALFASATNSFYDWRESKTVKPIDINIGKLVSWNATNTVLRPLLGRDLNSIYVWDRRTTATVPATNLGAVRVSNGQLLPPLGLTVATPQPLYVWGHYNQTNAALLGTSNTANTFPASLAGDSITVLSPAWTDANSLAALASRNASDTTVNAAFLAGSVDTTLGQYSGGMENFPRFLEYWNTTFTYNGSMVKMFPSLYATNAWGKANTYDPPSRNWTYDTNFNIPSKLPPLTPSLQTVIRSRWTTLAPNTTVASSSGP